MAALLRNKCLFFLLLILLVWTGCSYHPPSAAQFMNSENRSGLVVGGSFFSGDRYIGDYRFEDDYNASEDGGSFDLSLYFSLSHFVWGISTETFSFAMNSGFVSRYVGLQLWGGGGIGSVPEEESNSWYGGVMLIEEYPVSEDFRVGVSEHISRNAYKVDENLGGFGVGGYSTAYYSEFGLGTYLAYKDFSMEFRYGRQMDEPRNRFYFMVNYAFFVDTVEKKNN